MPALLRTNKEILEIYDRHADTVYRVCFAYMKNAPEAEDMTQETYQRHEKAWLIVTASNLCKDALKKWWRYSENIDDYTYLAQESTETGNEVLDAILALPPDYKDAVYMYYYEGFSTVEIARHLNCPESTVRSRLSRARKQLQTMLGGVLK